ncbi:sensor histidine kinase [Pedobacter sp. NJ-S-72]
MKEVLVDHGKLTELFDMIERQHAKIQRTVDSVLESSMYAEITPELEVHNIKEYLINYSKNLDFVSDRLEVNIEEKVCSVLLNPGLIEKALNNLIDNAVKYTEIGTEIRLKSYLEGRSYCIDITDIGSGIDPQYIRYIFDKFYRIPEKDKHTIKGLGLGLYLSKQAR